MKIKICISSPTGKIGSELIKTSKKKKDIILTSVLSTNKKLYKKDIGTIMGTNPTGIKVYNKISEIKNKIDVLIDFSHTKSSLDYLNSCKKYNKKIIIGTSGFNIKENNFIKKAAKKIAIVLSPNFSIGINLILKILPKISKITKNLYDIEIYEKHHKYKIDSPSATALTIGKTIAKSQNINLKKNFIYNRIKKQKKRKNKSIGFSSIRAGNIIGEHTILFASKEEEIKIFHRAYNRKTFAEGALKAASWIFKKKRGLFNMLDILKIQ